MKRSVAATLVVMIVTLGVGAEVLAKSDDGSMTEREIARCHNRNESAVRASEAAPSLVGIGNGLQADDEILGRGPIWVLSDAVQRAPSFDIVEGGWRAKFPWFRTKPGHLRVTGRRVDGSGRFKLPLHESSYPEIGFIPSILRFPHGGCWRITAKFRRTTIHFYMAFSTGADALCLDLDWQLDNIAKLRAGTPPGYVWPPENDRLEASLKEAWYGSGCDRRA